jgi:hypothetical protein
MLPRPRSLSRHPPRSPPERRTSGRKRERLPGKSLNADRIAKSRERDVGGLASILVDVNYVKVQNLLIAEELMPGEHIDYERGDAKARAAARDAWRPGVSLVVDTVADLMAFPEFRELLRRHILQKSKF